MPLESDADKRVVLHVYERYMEGLMADNCLTSDQVVNDFLNYLVTFTWNRRRADKGYDCIFVDELHLFDAQERLLLRYLVRTTRERPKIFMALDPRQSPWEVYTGLAGLSTATNADVAVEEDLGDEPYQKLGPPPASLQVTHTVARVSDKARRIVRRSPDNPQIHAPDIGTGQAHSP